MEKPADRSAARELARPYLNRWMPWRLTRDEVSETLIRYYCEVSHDANPVYWDAEFARTTRFGRVIAPPQGTYSYTFAPFWSPEAVIAKQRRDEAALNEGIDGDGADISQRIRERFRYTGNAITNHEMEFIAPYGPGDGRLLLRSRLLDVSLEKQTGPGRGVFVTNETEYYVEKDRRLVARATMTILFWDPSRPRETAQP